MTIIMFNDFKNIYIVDENEDCFHNLLGDKTFKAFWQ